MAIFGGILYLPFKSGTIVFIAVLVVFTIFEGLLHILEVECSKHGLKGLIKKMYREFMILGFISFAILLATELSHFQTNIWYDAFHFAHIVILFVGFVFLLQSGLLSALVRYRNRALLSHDNSSSEELIVEYVNMHNGGGIKKFLFNFGPISIPIPELREKIEYKIIQEFFVRNYNLPPEFKFANYMCGVLRHYVISLVEVRPISWVILAAFVALNLFRIEVIDPRFAKSVCHRYPAQNLHTGRRYLASLFADDAVDDVQHQADLRYGEHVCQEYMLRYTFVLSFFMVFYIIGVLVASEVYIQRLIGKVLDQEETIEWLEDEEQRNQMKSLMSQDTNDMYVDINHLPDDTFEGKNPQRAGSVDSHEAKIDSSGEGVEMTRLRAHPVAPRTSADSLDLNLSLAYPTADNNRSAVASPAGSTVAASHVAPRRMSAAYRQPSIRVRSGSAADMPEELADQLPPVPVYGAANVRRLSMMHRRNSLKDHELASMISQGIADHDKNGDHSPTPSTTMQSPQSLTQAQARRLSQNQKNNSYSDVPKPPLALDILIDPHPPVQRLAAHHRANSASSTISVPLEGGDTAAAGGAPLPGAMRRRLASHHRMGSLRSEISQIEAENQVGAATSGRRRLMSHHRQGSLGSEVSSTKNQESNGMKLVSAHNRRFLYLRCLERIMHVEFDFHANEAKRLGQQEQPQSPPTTFATGPNTAAPGTYSPVSPMDLPTSSKRNRTTIANANQSSMRDLLHSPSERRERANTRQIMRTNSVNSNQDFNSQMVAPPGSDLDLLHTDMRSNFRLMKDLRKEMLEEEKVQAQAHAQQQASHAPVAPRAAGLNSAPSMFNIFSGSGSAKSAAELKNRKIVESVSMDEELGGLAVQEMHELELAHDLDYEHENLHSNGMPRKPVAQRSRSFSLAFESPSHRQKSFSERKLERMSHLERFWYNICSACRHFYDHLVSALLGHHIGEAVAAVDADIADLQEDFTHIFLFKSAEFYYFSVEFCLLAQCVYLALWATNFVFIANDSYYPVLWNIALLVPVPINFLMTKQIIFTSVMLKSIVTLDKYVADKICEEAVDERNVKHRVRKVIRTALRTLEIPRENWQQFTMDQFELYIPDNDVGLNLANLNLFLHSMQIFLTDATVHRIFTVLDFDKDEKLVWDELMPIVFPELVRKQVKLNRQRNARRATLSFDYQFEGDLVTADVKKEEQKRHRRQKRASLLSDAGNLTDGLLAAKKASPRKSPRSKTNRGARSPDTRTENSDVDIQSAFDVQPSTGEHARTSARDLYISDGEDSEHLRSDDSDHGDISSDSSFNSHSLSGSSDSDVDTGRVVSHINSEADIDTALANSSHPSRDNSRSASRNSNNTSAKSIPGDERSVRFSNMYDV